MYKQINSFTYEIDESVIRGSEAAELIIEIIQSKNGATKFLFTNWSDGFADGIGMTLTNLGYHSDFDVLPDKNLMVYCAMR